MTAKRGDSTGESELALDTVFGLLSDLYRRRLLVTLLEHNPQDDDDIDQLADVSLADEDLENFRVTMTHTHLPKLAEADVIDWDREENVVRKGPLFDEIRPLLVLMRDNADALPDDWI